MAEQKCPNCGRDLPKELGQHSIAPMTGLVSCPYCGADVNLEREAAVGNTGTETSPAGEKPSTSEFAAPSTAAREASAREEGDGDTFTGDESSERFSGSETMEGVKKEIEEKDQ
jgi:uncharacterized Zn finger protein (UPF0148 family)